MGRVATILLPLPPIEASLNFHPATRGGRLAQNKAIQEYKAVVIAKMKAAKPKDGWPEGPLLVSYHWYTGRRYLKGSTRSLRDGLCRPKDEDNAIGAAKPIQDAMQLAGLLPKGDAAGRVRLGELRIFGTKRLHGGAMQVIVIVSTDTEANADADKAGGR